MMEQYEEYSLQTIPEDRDIQLERLYDQLIVTSGELLDNDSKVYPGSKKYVFNGVEYA